jgi:hypothetical protein
MAGGCPCPRGPGRHRLAALKPGAKLLAVRLGPLLVSDRRRSPTGFPGNERHDRAVVRAQARTRHGHRQLGNGRC